VPNNICHTFVYLQYNSRHTLINVGHNLIAQHQRLPCRWYDLQ